MAINWRVTSAVPNTTGALSITMEFLENGEVVGTETFDMDINSTPEQARCEFVGHAILFEKARTPVVPNPDIQAFLNMTG